MKCNYCKKELTFLECLVSRTTIYDKDGAREYHEACAKYDKKKRWRENENKSKIR